MTRRRIVVVLVAAAALAWWLHGKSDSRAPVASSGPAPREIDPGLADQLALGRQAMRNGSIRPGFHLPHDTEGSVAIAGTVVDAESHEGVGNVEVVFKSALGESSTTSNADGTYRIEVVPGVYRAYVRDDVVLSVGQPDHIRLPTLPSADAAGVPDEALIPTVVAKADTAGLDLSVLRGGEVEGRVVDAHGHPVAGVVLRARSNMWRPALGTDLVETDHDGTFSMKLPAGGFVVEANHPQYAGLDHSQTKAVIVQPGGHTHQDFTLVAGCVVSGHVVGADGKAAGDGAIERKWGEADTEFGPAGQINGDGTFRWVSTEEADITLRAWPWKSPPSPARTFTCKDGARYNDVVFALPSASPDLAGVLVDRSGAPVPFAYIDLAPLDNGINQQERTDAQGRWSVYSMPAGRYTFTAYAPERGVVATTLVAPVRDARVVLGGTGRLEGTTTELANGSFELSLAGCDLPGGSVPLPHEPRIVPVTNGSFSIDGLPACILNMTAEWHGHTMEQQIEIVADNTAQTQMAIGPPRAKTIHGTVRDEAGAPVAGANVNAFIESEDVSVATTDAGGHYTLHSYSGAQVTASAGQQYGQAQVGRANIDDEQVDLSMAKMEYEMDVENGQEER